MASLDLLNLSIQAQIQVAGGFQAFFLSDAARSEAHPGHRQPRDTEIDRAKSRAPLFGASAAHRQWEDLLVAVRLLPGWLFVDVWGDLDSTRSSTLFP